jgi:glycosyltransferase involved in cell wall biosynthesis
MVSQVTFIGFVSGADKDLLLQGADIFALLSYSENFGIAVAEALAASLPVVITPGIQIASDVAAAQAGLIVTGELESAISAIQQLLNSSQLRHQLGKNGQLLAQSSYYWPAIAIKLAQAYSSILNSK